MVCLPADYESKVRRCRDTVCDCHARGYWDAVTFSPRDYAKLLFTGIVSYTSIYRGLCAARSLTRCRADFRGLSAKLYPSFAIRGNGVKLGRREFLYWKVSNLL